MGAFQLDREMDSAVAALVVTCPYFDSVSGTECRWTGRLEQFDNHAHVFDDQQQHDPTAEEPRGTKRARSVDDLHEVYQDEEVNLDEGQIPPPPKVIRIGDVELPASFLNFMRVNSRGLHFSTQRPDDAVEEEEAEEEGEEEEEPLTAALAAASAAAAAAVAAVAAAVAAAAEEEEEEEEDDDDDDDDDADDDDADDDDDTDDDSDSA